MEDIDLSGLGNEIVLLRNKIPGISEETARQIIRMSVDLSTFWQLSLEAAVEALSAALKAEFALDPFKAYRFLPFHFQSNIGLFIGIRFDFGFSKKYLLGAAVFGKNKIPDWSNKLWK